MAGPAAAIVLPKNISLDDKAIILNGLASSSEKFEGFDGSEYQIRNTQSIGGMYTGEGRPFIISFGFQYDGEQEEIKEALASKTEIFPHDMVILAAMCNSIEDHQILAELCCFVAKKLDGLVMFDSSLKNYTSDQSILQNMGRITTSNIGDFLTSNLLMDWMNHPDFTMVK